MSPSAPGSASSSARLPISVQSLLSAFSELRAPVRAVEAGSAVLVRPLLSSLLLSVYSRVCATMAFSVHPSCDAGAVPWTSGAWSYREYEKNGN